MDLLSLSFGELSFGWSSSGQIFETDWDQSVITCRLVQVSSVRSVSDYLSLFYYVKKKGVASRYCE